MDIAWKKFLNHVSQFAKVSGFVWANLGGLMMKIRTLWKLADLSASFLTVIFLSVIILSISIGAYLQNIDENTSLGELGSFVAGAASPLLILWLIYSVQIQIGEMASQRQIRKYTTGESIMRESRQLLNSEIKSLLMAFEIEEAERSVFDLDELPYILSESKEFIEMGKVSFQTDAILYQVAKRYLEIYANTLQMLERVDNTGRVKLFLTFSRYETIKRSLEGKLVKSGN